MEQESESGWLFGPSELGGSLGPSYFATGSTTQLDPSVCADTHVVCEYAQIGLRRVYGRAARFWCGRLNASCLNNYSCDVNC
jgi:hypothetical protein